VLFKFFGVFFHAHEKFQNPTVDGLKLKKVDG
jgi:hypothetical protein